MAKRPPGSQRRGSSSPAGRPAPIKIQKSFPWGTVLGSVALAAVLIGIVAYAALNQGSGFEDPVERADKRFPGLVVAGELSRDHVDGNVDYPEEPPMGGEHSSLPQQCGVYTEQIPSEHAVHSLEHGAVWVTYRPDLPADQVKKLTDVVDGDPYGLLSPLPGQQSPIELTAWGRQLAVDNADDGRIQDFVSTYTSGPSTPERGAACVGNTGTGSSPVGAAPDGSMPAPAAPAPAAPAPATSPSS